MPVYRTTAAASGPGALSTNSLAGSQFHTPTIVGEPFNNTCHPLVHWHWSEIRCLSVWYEKGLCPQKQSSITWNLCWRAFLCSGSNVSLFKVLSFTSVQDYNTYYVILKVYVERPEVIKHLNIIVEFHDNWKRTCEGFFSKREGEGIWTLCFYKLYAHPSPTPPNTQSLKRCSLRSNWKWSSKKF